MVSVALSMPEFSSRLSFRKAYSGSGPFSRSTLPAR